MAIPTPIEFWTFNNTRVGAVAGNTLVWTDGVERYLESGIIGQCVRSPGGVGKYLQLDAATAFAPTPGTPFSWSVWNCPETASTSYMIGLFDGSTTKLTIAHNLLNSLDIRAWGTTLQTLRDTWLPGVWKHVVFTCSATGMAKAYLDGNVVVSEQLTITPCAAPRLRICGNISSAAQQLDCLGYWNLALSDAEVEQLYNAGNGWEYEPTPPDNTPDAFSFANVLNAEPATQYVSDPAEVTGMDAGTAISVANGEYRINGGAWTSDAGTIDPGDTLELRGTSSGEPKGVVAVSVTVGTLTKEWTVETRQARRFRFVCEGFVF